MQFFPWLAILVAGLLTFANAQSVPSSPSDSSESPQALANRVAAEVRKAPSLLAQTIQEAVRMHHQRDTAIRPEKISLLSAIAAGAASASTAEDVPVIISTMTAEDPRLALIASTTCVAIHPKGLELDRMVAVELPKILGTAVVVQTAGSDLKVLGSDGVWRPLKRGEFLRQGQKILTGPDSTVDLLLDNGSSIHAMPETELSIDRFLVEPFQQSGVDFKALKKEPTRSVVRLGISQGTILLNVTPLDERSVFHVVHPSGTVRVVGTGFFVNVLPGAQGSAVSVGVSHGEVQVTSPSGVRQSVKSGQAVGLSETGSLESQVAPTNLIQAVATSAESASSAMSQAPFAGAPAAAIVPPGRFSNLPIESQQALEVAAERGDAAVIEAVIQLAESNPLLAGDLAGAAAEIAPGSALGAVRALASSFPQQAAAIAVSAAAASPSQSNALATTVAGVVPTQAAGVASAIAAIFPTQAPTIAASVAQIVPSQASAVAGSVAATIPAQAVQIASAVASAVPSQASAISTAVGKAVPAEAAAIQSAISGSIQGRTLSPPTNTSVSINPASLATPTPVPPPVSPSR